MTNDLDFSGQVVLVTGGAQGIGVRLGIKTTGCSGFAYQLEYADEARADRKSVV